MMAAHLRLPEAMTDAAKEAYVDGIIQRLGMTKSADTIVGDAKVRFASACGQDIARAMTLRRVLSACHNEFAFVKARLT
jgi:hypothetical protein